MNKSTVLLACVMAGLASQADAQTVSPAFDAWLKSRRAPAQSDAAPPTPPAPQPPSTAALAGPSSGPDTQPAQAASALSAPVPPQARRAEPAAAIAPTATASAVPVPPQPRTREQPRNASGAFIGVQAGKGWLYDDVDQTLYGLSAGYRWRAGPVSLIGIEAAAGRLEGRTKHDTRYGDADVYRLGATARFNFGRRSPWFATARLGYWYGDTSSYEERYVYVPGPTPYAPGSYYIDQERRGEHAYGAYAGFGIGVDLGRHASLSLDYTGYVYSSSDDDTYDPNYADTLTLGVEVRF